LGWLDHQAQGPGSHWHVIFIMGLKKIGDTSRLSPILTLIVWGNNDFIFPVEGAGPYSRDLKNIETHPLETGHFALETHGEEIASRIEDLFIKRRSKAA